MTKTLLVGLLVLVGCKEQGVSGTEGAPGKDGAPGVQGPAGAPGAAGAAGAAGPAGQDATASGTRLTARYLVGGDGSRAFAGWHDTMLNTDCTYGVASDGMTRCLPSGAGTVQSFVGSSEAFYSTDPTCAAPSSVFVVPACVPAVAFAVAPKVQMSICSPPGTTAVYAVGPQIQTPPAMIYQSQGGTCVGGPTDTTQATYYAFTVVDPASLVAGVVQ